MPWRGDLCTVAAVQHAEDSDELAEERQLCERAQTGDRDALGAILRQHGPRLYRSVLLGFRLLADLVVGDVLDVHADVALDLGRMGRRAEVEGFLEPYAQDQRRGHGRGGDRPGRAHGG